VTEENGISKLAQIALDYSEAGNHEAAVEVLQKVLRGVPDHHYRASLLHGQLASALEFAGRAAEARPHYEKALQLELADSGDEGSAGVRVARYFLGEYFLRSGEPALALEAVRPMLEAGHRQAALAYLVAAEALLALGDVAEARSAATRSVALALKEQRPSIEERLAKLLHHRHEGAG
jgi:tetratricopeptide (TPR) repeat protein